MTGSRTDPAAKPVSNKRHDRCFYEVILAPFDSVHSRVEPERDRRDLAAQVADQLCTIHMIFEAADETYRRFRVMVMQPVQRQSEFIPPVEWIPLSKH